MSGDTQPAETPGDAPVEAPVYRTGEPVMLFDVIRFGFDQPVSNETLQIVAIQFNAEWREAWLFTREQPSAVLTVNDIHFVRRGSFQ